MKKNYGNPILPLAEYIPDGEPHLFNERIYLYGSHDRAGGTSYCEEDYVCYSAPKDDLTAWHYEGVIYRKIDDPENKDGRKPLFAPDVTKGIDGRYYLYYALAGERFISVAVSDVPQGPFQFYGKITNDFGDVPKQGAAFDPAVYVENGQVYLYYGFSSFDNHLNSRFGIEENYGAYVVELDKDMKCIISEPKCVAYGGEYAKSTSFENHPFYEASSLRKIYGKYYFIYSSFQGHELCYALGDTPTGPFEYQGVIISNVDYGINGNTVFRNVKGNNHGSLLQIEDDLYIFYHRHTHGTHYSRQACVEKLNIDKTSGKIAQVGVSSSGVLPTLSTSNQIYPAAIACHMYHPNGVNYPYMIENEKESYITNIKTGGVVGYRYLDLSQQRNCKLIMRGSSGEVSVFADANCQFELFQISFTESFEWQEVQLVLPAYDYRSSLFFRFTVLEGIELLSLAFH